MTLQPARYLEQDEKKEREERIRLIGLIMGPEVPRYSEDKCGKRFDQLYDKTLPELRIYYQVFK